LPRLGPRPIRQLVAATGEQVQDSFDEAFEQLTEFGLCRSLDSAKHNLPTKLMVDAIRYQAVCGLINTTRTNCLRFALLGG